MRTSSNNNIFTVIGVKNDGKTTIATYLMEQINKPTVIIDRACQFTENTPYRIIVKGINHLRYWLNNPLKREAFIKGKLQLIYRCTQRNKVKEIEEVCFMLHDVRNICIFFEEMELYADFYLNKNSDIFETLYLSRNTNTDIICVIKEVGNLNKLVKSATDYFILGQIRDLNAEAYFNKRSKGKFIEKSLLADYKKREFIFTDLVDFWEVFALDKQTVKTIK